LIIKDVFKFRTTILGRIKIETETINPRECSKAKTIATRSIWTSRCFSFNSQNFHFKTGRFFKIARNGLAVVYSGRDYGSEENKKLYNITELKAKERNLVTIQH